MLPLPPGHSHQATPTRPPPRPKSSNAYPNSHLSPLLSSPRSTSIKTRPSSHNTPSQPSSSFLLPSPAPIPAARPTRRYPPPAPPLLCVAPRLAHMLSTARSWGPRRPAPEEIPPLPTAATRRGEVDLDRRSQSTTTSPPADDPDHPQPQGSTTTSAPPPTSASASVPVPVTVTTDIPPPVSQPASSSQHHRAPASSADAATAAPAANIASSAADDSADALQPPAAQPPTILGRRRRSSRLQDPDESLAPPAAADKQTQPSPKRRRTRADMATDDSGPPANGALAQASNGHSASSSSQPANGTTSNGTLKSIATNGTSNKGKRVAGSKPESYFGHNREEVTRILIQALTDMGYQAAAESISSESGFDLESPTVAAFRSSVLQGAWAETEKLLDGAVTVDDEEPGNGLVLAPGSDRNMMRFWVRQQKYLELLEQRDTSQALMALRTDLTPLSQDAEKLRLLSSLLMCRSTEDLMAKANWDGAQGDSRQRLLSELSKCISPSVMLPENRLAVLLDHVKKSQIDRCLYHTAASSPSLYADHSCERRNFPTEVALELSDLAGEAWQVQFSHDGTRLAACGSSEIVIIWETTSFAISAILSDHEAGVGNVSWSPDDTMIVTCSQDRFARLWDARTGKLIKKLASFDEPVSGCLWAPDSRSFVLGGLSRTHGLCTFHVDSDEIQEWGKNHRVQDLAASPDGRWLVAVDDQQTYHVYNAKTREFIYQHELKTRPTSVSISEDSKHMLVNKRDGEAQLIEIETKIHKQKFLGHTGGDFLIRSSFGGANEGFVISGSEDGNILIWHKNTGAAVERLQGHSPRCNAVAWNPTDPCMLASGGDDCRVKIWSNKARAAELRALHVRPSGTSARWRDSDDGIY